MGSVAVAMSGGVDSSVAAAELLESGQKVIGLTMLLGDLPSMTAAVSDAASAAAHLGIEHHVVDVRTEFRARVLEPYLDDYLAGKTPNPCVRCNPDVKVALLLARARELGADMLATGHYARIAPAAGRARLLVGIDAEKDQSYFLYALDEAALSALLFPLGTHIKSEVRARAAVLGLPVAERPESQDACFVGEDGHVAFIRSCRDVSGRAGDIVDAAGKVLGAHDGIESFTIGQRRGTGVSAGVPMYVTGIHPDTATVVVGPLEALARTWVAGQTTSWHDSSVSGRCEFKHRYRARAVSGDFSLSGDRLVVTADEPLGSVAPGQALVCYKGETVLGGGTITEAG